MTYFESEADSSFVINSASNFNSDSDSDSDSDSSLVFMNLLIFVCFFYTYILREKLVDNYSFPFS